MKKVIIIGATSGIGKALAALFAANSYKVGVTGRRNEKLLELQQVQPNNFTTKAFDITSSDSISKLTELVEELGGLDILVLSSGIGNLNETLDYAIEQETITLNVNGFTEIMDWGFSYFQKQGHGHLVGISSIAGIRGSKIAPAYNASKAYQINYLEGLQQKVKQLGTALNITDVRPGFVDTAMAKGEGQFWVATKEKAAEQLFIAIKQKRKIVYITKRWRIIALLLKVLPSWLYYRM